MEFGAKAREWLGLWRGPTMTWAEVREARAALPPDDPRQKELALEDRRAFAREQVEMNPWRNVPGLLVAIPVWELGKAAGHVLGVKGGIMGRSGYFDLIGSMAAGYRGMLEGLDKRGLFGQ